MGKPNKPKAKPPAAKGGGSQPSKGGSSQPVLLRHAPLLMLAVAVQLLLTWGYFSYGAAEPPSAEVPAAAATAATKCPADWPTCPAGADWEALEQMESAEGAPSADELTHCKEIAGELLSPQRVPGMSLLCVLPAPPTDDVGVRLAVFEDMYRALAPKLVLLPPSLKRSEDLVATLERKLGVPARQNPQSQPGAVFSDVGIRIRRAAKLGSMRRALLMTGGQWLWPPGEVGHAHVLPDLTAPGVDTRVVTRSLRPLVVEIENFLSGDEAAHIVERARPHMEKSGVALKDADIGKAAKEFRTSSQYFLPTTNDKTLERVDERVQTLTRIPISHAEFIQVLRYDHMEHYSAHHDFFNPREYASNPRMLREVENGAKNRLATVFFYLNNVTKGGETNFPRAQTAQFPDGGPVPRDYFDCSRGLSVYPEEGKVIIFYSMLPNGQTDEFSLHGGCDVLDPEATKWSANFWLWNKPYHFVSPARKKMVQRLQAKWH